MRDTFTGMFVGYLFIWTLFAIYFLLLGRRLTRLEKRLETVEFDGTKDEPADSA